MCLLVLSVGNCICAGRRSGPDDLEMPVRLDTQAADQATSGTTVHVHVHPEHTVLLQLTYSMLVAKACADRHHSTLVAKAYLSL